MIKRLDHQQLKKQHRAPTFRKGDRSERKHDVFVQWLRELLGAGRLIIDGETVNLRLNQVLTTKRQLAQACGASPAAVGGWIRELELDHWIIPVRAADKNRDALRLTGPMLFEVKLRKPNLKGAISDGANIDLAPFAKRLDGIDREALKRPGGVELRKRTVLLQPARRFVVSLRHDSGEETAFLPGDRLRLLRSGNVRRVDGGILNLKAATVFRLEDGAFATPLGESGGPTRPETAVGGPERLELLDGQQAETLDGSAGRLAVRTRLRLAHGGVVDWGDEFQDQLAQLPSENWILVRRIIYATCRGVVVNGPARNVLLGYHDALLDPQIPERTLGVDGQSSSGLLLARLARLGSRDSMRDVFKRRFGLGADFGRIVTGTRIRASEGDMCVLRSFIDSWQSSGAPATDAAGPANDPIEALCLKWPCPLWAQFGMYHDAKHGLWEVTLEKYLDLVALEFNDL